MYRKLIDASKFIESHVKVKPRIGFILGSGLKKFADTIQNTSILPFAEIPQVLPEKLKTHEGRFIFGNVTAGTKDIPVVVQRGRLHYYEGYTMDEVVFPTRLMCMLGIETLVIVNAAGAVNPEFREADIMLITDHINLIGDNPLKGPNVKEFGPRFPDLSEAYNKNCLDVFKESARKINLTLREGVYVALSGPTFETPAEVRMIRILGGDVVGMSTIPEVIAANHFGVRVAGISCVTNLASGITSKKVSHDEVVHNASKSADKVVNLINTALPSLIGNTQ